MSAPWSYPLPRPCLTCLAALLLVSGWACSARAQDELFLVPDRFEVSSGSSFLVHTEREHDGASSRTAWPARAMRWLFLRVEGKQENHDRIWPTVPGGDTASLAVVEGGITLVGLDLLPRVEDLDRAAFEEFLRDHGTGQGGVMGTTPRVAERERKRLEVPEAARAPARWALPGGEAERVRVRRIESAKTLLRVGPIDPDSVPAATAQSKTGQAAELRLLADPTALSPGADLPLRAYAGGSAVPHARVVATSLADGSQRGFQTDANGIGWFRLSRGGPWRVAFHLARRLENDPRADGELWSATITFDVPERKGEVR